MEETTFTCQRCGYVCKKKYSLMRHLSKQKPCECKHENVDRAILMTSLKKTISHSSLTFQCEFCCKLYSSRQAKHKHQLICNQRPEKLLTKRIEELEKLVKSQNIINNTTNNYNITNNNTFILNPFQRIDTSYISDNKKFLLCNQFRFDKLYDSLKEVIRLQYYNNKHPENHAIYIPNTSKNKVKIWNGSNWIYEEKNKIITIMRNNGVEFLNEYFTDNEIKFDMIQKQNMHKFWSKYIGDEKCFDKKSKNAVENSILSYQNVVKNTIEKYNLL